MYRCGLAPAGPTSGTVVRETLLGNLETATTFRFKTVHGVCSVSPDGLRLLQSVLCEEPIEVTGAGAIYRDGPRGIRDNAMQYPSGTLALDTGLPTGLRARPLEIR